MVFDTHLAQAEALERSWREDARWQGVRRDYRAEQVVRLRPSLKPAHTWSEIASRRLWHLLNHEPYLHTFGALSGAQAVQMVQAGLKAIYVSGWQVAADQNAAGQTYPDQSLYPSHSMPMLVRRINQALMRRDQVARVAGEAATDWYVPLVADAEAGFGGPLHAFELVKSLIEAGVGGVHLEDQLASEKKCGHLGGKVLVPTSQFIRTLRAARLAADVLDVPNVLIARTDALSAGLITSDIDPADHASLTGERTSEGFWRIQDGLAAAIRRGLAYAPYADVLWFESSHPDLAEAAQFAAAIHARYPGKRLAYNCSPSFNWRQQLDNDAIAAFQPELGRMGYAFQFVTLAGWHLLNFHSFELASAYRAEGMPAYVALQARELAASTQGYTAVRHQQEVGTGYFDAVLDTLAGGLATTGALRGSTEAAQFHGAAQDG
ncbi:MAG: isocitrate lyase [Candidatus Sericytochromatia bacterium]|nr:isocitrate lyase [Candidatus Sericytochromatia bacterium]